MTFQVTVQPSGHQFSCEEDETILAAAMRAGVGLPYGCKNGACSSCKGKVLSGRHPQAAPGTRPDQGRGSGRHVAVLLRHRPQRLVIEAREVAGSDDYPIRKMPSRVATLEKVAPDVVVMTLQLPANETLKFRAGQYIEFCCATASAAATAWPRAGPEPAAEPAHPPHAGRPVHRPGVQHHEGTRHPALRRPDGHFFVREDSDKPMVLLASGTGFAPIKAIVEHLRAQGSQRR
jgi:CDP-4-dehydro-6-deoxyglucose reductase